METPRTDTHGTDDAIRDSMVSRFSKIPGVGQSKAHILYDAGFTSFDSLRRASEKDFAEINGISPAFASHLKREVARLPKDIEKDISKTSGGLSIKADGVDVKPKPDEQAKDKTPIPTDGPKPKEGGRDARPGRGVTAEEDEGSSGIFKKLMRGFTGKTEPTQPAEKPKPQEKGPVSIKAVKEEPKKEGEAAKEKPKEDLRPDE